MAIYFGS